MKVAGMLAIASLIVVGGLTQSAPRLCPLPLRTLAKAPAHARAVNADRPAHPRSAGLQGPDGAPAKSEVRPGERAKTTP